MSDSWSARAEAYRDSPRHREGPDLELVVAWCEPVPGRSVLDVATGGGHVARRLREEGCTVVTCDAAPGMQPDVVCRAEDLPFADASFDVVVNRIAAHHFDDIPRAVREMARVTRGLVVVQDLVYQNEACEEAERVRDPSHVRNLSEGEWRTVLEDAGLTIEQVERVERQGSFERWLALTECTGDDARRVRELLADSIDGDDLQTNHVIFKTRLA